MVELDEKFVNSIIENYPVHKDLIIDAYKFANKMHDGVTRKSGEPYIIHPVAVSQILIDNNMDYSTIMAGLLHDVVEDTPVTLADIRKKYGETVAKLVDGVTKIDEIKLKAKNLTEEESIKHLLLAMGNDLRVIFIKLADRLHNMRTIEFLKREKQIRMATETKELFIPIAERIGVRKLRSELQALTFKCLHPEEYTRLKTELVRKLTKRKDQVDNIEKKMFEILEKNNIECKIIGWPEHTYSVYKKLMSQDKDISKVYTLMLFRVIVPTEEDCYKTLGLLHKIFKPVPAQIKDHIADPKPNGYQSLHTVLISNDADITFKVMIRTPKMDKTCEYGISSYWQNKDNDVEFEEKFEKHNNLKDIILGENLSSHSTSSFIDAVKTDLSGDSTWVLTPKFKAVCVNSANPTAIDFAYAVHTKIGNNAVSAIINGKKSSLRDVLKSGDVVEIVLSEKDKAPSRNWLSVVKTVNARRRIKEYINKHTTPENIEKGKFKLQEELKKSKHSLTDMIEVFPQIKEAFDFVDLEDMYASIGYESVTIQQITYYVLQKDRQKKLSRNSPVEIKGETSVENIVIPKCCCPIYGDPIVGVVSKNGVTIHTTNCLNLKTVEQSRFVQVAWKRNVNRLFDVNLKVVLHNAIGVASKMLGRISKQEVNISKITAKEINADICEIDICVGVHNNTELEDLIAVIKTVREVKTVNRYFD